MRLKIYFEDKPLFLTDTMDEEIELYRHHDDAVYMDELSAPAINSMIHEMRNSHIHAGIHYHEDFDALKKGFFKKFVPITAAGGAVINDEGNVLLIYRRNKWDLPKGKMEDGEDPETCALREIKEETGLEDIQLEKFLLTTYHTYDEKGKHMLKDTHWFLLGARSGQPLRPQKEEDITNAVWAEVSALSAYRKKTYQLIADVLDKIT